VLMTVSSGVVLWGFELGEVLLDAMTVAPVAPRSDAGRLCEVADVVCWERGSDSGLGLHCARPSVGTPAA
jgi:hypothetical protein